MEEVDGGGRWIEVEAREGIVREDTQVFRRTRRAREEGSY
jgi:hypothetical protein